MEAMATFGDVVEKLKKYAGKDSKGFKEVVSNLSSQIVDAISYSQTNYTMYDVFDALKTFEVDGTALGKMDVIVGVLSRMVTFFRTAKKIASEDMGALALLGMISTITDHLYTISSAFEGLQELPVINLKNFKGMQSIARSLYGLQRMFAKVRMRYFGENGVIANVAREMVESYNATYDALNLMTAKPIDLQMRLTRFAESMGISTKSFQIKNEQLKFTVNIKVELDAEKMVETMADKRKMGSKTVQLVAG